MGDDQRRESISEEGPGGEEGQVVGLKAALGVLRVASQPVGSTGVGLAYLGS